MDDCVSRETISDFVAEFDRWNEKISLVSKTDTSRVVARHVQDSLRVVRAGGPNWVSWADFGSGGGFPGLLVALAYPGRKVTLVESDRRKAAFLRSMGRKFELQNLTVLTDRVEALQPLKADVISARALARLTLLLEYASGHMHERTVLLFPKGADWEAENLAARKEWTYDLEVIESSDPMDGPVLRLRSLQRREQSHG